MSTAPPSSPSASHHVSRSPAVPRPDHFDMSRMWTVARTDLRQLREARDFWLPMALLGSFFFVLVPGFLLTVIEGIGNVGAVQQVSDALQLLPARAQAAVPASADPSTKVQYVLAVYLFAPIAVVVPLTISSAVGASTLVGERERGTGEFLAHCPADTREIYVGKLLASIIPGYLTTAVGFGAYSLIVNTVVGPDVGGWFFPTVSWWLLIGWVLPAFLAISLSFVLRLSARVKSTAAAQQATGLVTLPLIIIAYGQSTGALATGSATVSIVIGAIAWIIAALSLSTGVRSVRRGQLLGVADT
jgi:ABC-2 type transport system permease protein